MQMGMFMSDRNIAAFAVSFQGNPDIAGIR